MSDGDKSFRNANTNNNKKLLAYLSFHSCTSLLCLSFSCMIVLFKLLAVSNCFEVFRLNVLDDIWIYKIIWQLNCYKTYMMKAFLEATTICICLIFPRKLSMITMCIKISFMFMKTNSFFFLHVILSFSINIR